MPLAAKGSRAQSWLHDHLPSQTRMPFNKLTGATEAQNSKQIHGVVFVKDKELSLSLMLSEGFGRHSDQPPQIVSVPWTSSHISLIGSCHSDTLSFTWWQSFEDTRNQSLCWFHCHISCFHTCSLPEILRAKAKFNSTLLLYLLKAKFTHYTQICTHVYNKTFRKNTQLHFFVVIKKAEKDLQSTIF